MNKDLGIKALSERMNISGWDFYAPLQVTELNEMDMADHKCRLEEVYKGMLREACVIDDCCRRFENMFGWNGN